MNFLLIFCTSALSFLLGYLRHIYNYWQQQEVPQLPTHFLFGNFFKLKSVQHKELLQQSYDAFKGRARLAGSYVYSKPIAVIIDLELISRILRGDCNKFSDHVELEQGEQLRQQLMLTFGSDQLEQRFNTVASVAKQLQATLQQSVQTAVSDASLELHELLCRYASDALSSCAFGIDSDALKQPQGELSMLGRHIFTAHAKRNVRWHIFKATYAELHQPLVLPCLDQQSTNFFKRILHAVQQTDRDTVGQSSDFIELLWRLLDADNEQTLTQEQLAMQLLVLLADAYVSSASHLSFALYELAKNEQVQQRLRKQIQQVLHKQKQQQLSYLAMQQMTYLDLVISETLRKYPSYVALRRIAKEDYRLTGADDHIELERGTQLYIPVHAIHHDAEIYTNPQEFQPERFEQQASQQRPIMAFFGLGAATYSCVGSPLECMIVKLGLITLLQGHRFSLPPNAATQLAIAQTADVTTPKDGVRLGVQQLRSN